MGKRKNYRVAALLYTNQDYGRRVFVGAEDYAASTPDFSLSLVNVQRKQDRWYEYKQLESCDGVIAVLTHPETKARRPNLAVPIVEVPLLFADYGVPLVSSDSHRIGEAAAQHLLSLRLKNIGLLSAASAEDLTELAAGFNEELARAGIAPLDLPKTMQPASSDDWTWLRALPLPAGLLCPNDGPAARIIRAATEQGRRVPEDLAVCGIGDDVLRAVATQPRLTSIAVRAQEIGRQAAAGIHRLLQGKPFAPVRVPHAGVTERDSTRMIAIDDPAVREAVIFIREHRGRLVRVGDIADHVGLSRRTLENRFRSVLHCGVHDEVTRHRLDRAKHLLTDTDLPMKAIATELGVRNPNNLSQLVTKHTGLSPTAYRRQSRQGQQNLPK